MKALGRSAIPLMICLGLAGCKETKSTAPTAAVVHHELAMGEILIAVLDSGKEATLTPGSGKHSLKVRKLDPNSPLDGLIDPKFVAIGEMARIRSGNGEWIDGHRSFLEGDFLSYASAAKSTGSSAGPQMVVELSRHDPNPEAIQMVLESAAAAGFTDVWVAKELPAPPRKLPVNPARPVPPPR